MTIGSIIDLSDNLSIVPTLVELHAAEWPEVSLSRDRRDLILSRSSTAATPKTFVYMIDGSSAAGFAAIADTTLLPGRAESPWVTTLLVDPRYRGVGIGKSLLTRCVEHARTSGISVLHLHTTEAADYYRRITGWVEYEVEYEHDRPRAFFKTRTD